MFPTEEPLLLRFLFLTEEPPLASLRGWRVVVIRTESWALVRESNLEKKRFLFRGPDRLRPLAFPPASPPNSKPETQPSPVVPRPDATAAVATSTTDTATFGATNKGDVTTDKTDASSVVANLRVDKLLRQVNSLLTATFAVGVSGEAEDALHLVEGREKALLYLERRLCLFPKADLKSLTLPHLTLLFLHLAGTSEDHAGISDTEMPDASEPLRSASAVSERARLADVLAHSGIQERVSDVLSSGTPSATPGPAAAAKLLVYVVQVWQAAGTPQTLSSKLITRLTALLYPPP
ncbi:hypothetical protein T484DRAFT_1895097, partial [Baffinella frigidus]